MVGIVSGPPFNVTDISNGCVTESHLFMTDSPGTICASFFLQAPPSSNGFVTVALFYRSKTMVGIVSGSHCFLPFHPTDASNGCATELHLFMTDSPGTICASFLQQAPPS